MELSTLGSWSSGLHSGATEEQEIGSVATERCCLEPPNRNWSAGQIVEHVIAVHCRFIEQSLARLATLISQAAQEGSQRAGQWNAIEQRFVKLQDELLRCAAHERAVIFPELLSLEQTASCSSASPALLDEVQTVERWHARCLQILWRLLRVAKDETVGRDTSATALRVVAELSALCDHFEQCLFEEECLLFARIYPLRKGKPR